MSNYLRYYYDGHEDMKKAEEFDDIMRIFP